MLNGEPLSASLHSHHPSAILTETATGAGTARSLPSPLCLKPLLHVDACRCSADDARDTRILAECSHLGRKSLMSFELCCRSTRPTRSSHLAECSGRGSDFTWLVFEAPCDEASTRTV